MTRPLPLLLAGLLIAIAVPAVALAVPQDTSVSRLLACRHIAADAARLACFDRTSAVMARAPASALRPPAVPAPSAPAPTQAMKQALDPQRTFGLPHAAIVQREAAAAGLQVKEAPNITAHIAGLGQDPDGRTIFSLDNGQVWVQLVPDGTDLYAKRGEAVRISRGWLESYWLETASHHGCKVTRLR